MKLIFAGTPEFAETALVALSQAGHQVSLVLTRPDQAAGRGQQLKPSPVKVRAAALGIPVFQPRTLRDETAQARIAAEQADLMVVAAYGLILPQAVLDLPRRGCLNIHASLLPRWRGAAPIQRAIEAGDQQSGVTIMQMDAGLDTGAMLLRQGFTLAVDETGGSLHDRLALLGGQMIVDALERLAAGSLPAQPQPAQGVTYAAKLDKRESAIDWSLDAVAIERRLRAFDPFPGCTAMRVGEPAAPIKVWRGRVVAPQSAMPASVPVAPGTIISAGGAAGLRVACGVGEIELLSLQKPGARRLAAGEFLRGFALQVGDRFAALHQESAGSPPA